MDFFRGLIEQILKDITLAQHQSNLLSASLVPGYRDPEQHHLPPDLNFFPVPNSIISSIAITLKFGIEELSDLMADEPRGALSNAARAIIETLMSRQESEAVELSDTPNLLNNPDASNERSLIILELAIVNFLLVEWMQCGTADTATEWVEKICSRLQSLLASLPEPAIELSALEISAIASQHLLDAFTTPPSSKQLAAILKSQQLNALNPETYSSITINCDMRNFELGFREDKPKDTRLVLHN
jgi:hypothetical protein